VESCIVVLIRISTMSEFLIEVRMNLNDDQATRLKNADYVIEDPLVFVDLLVDLMFIADIIINFR